MAMGDDDKLKGKLDKVKGHVKGAIGEATGNRDIKDEGDEDRAKGSMERLKGGIKNAVDPDNYK